MSPRRGNPLRPVDSMVCCHTGKHHSAIVLHASCAGNRAFSKGWRQGAGAQNIFRFNRHLHLHIEIRKTCGVNFSVNPVGS